MSAVQNSPEMLEAIRLIHTFFPESKAHVFPHMSGLSDMLYAAMNAAGSAHDFSCDPWLGHSIEQPTLASKGGIDGTEEAIYLRLLEHTGFSPTGRVVVIPDAMVRTGELRVPFVCDCKRLPERLREFSTQRRPGLINRPFVFDGSSDSAFVFESGEAFLLDHDARLFWATSKLRR